MTLPLFSFVVFYGGPFPETASCGLGDQGGLRTNLRSSYALVEKTSRLTI